MECTHIHISLSTGFLVEDGAKRKQPLSNLPISHFTLCPSSQGQILQPVHMLNSQLLKYWEGRESNNYGILRKRMIWQF